MSGHSTLHHTFTLERHYGVSPEEVFAAWSDPKAKGRWFAGSVEHYELDFREGGHERVRTTMGSGRQIEFDAVYRDIVPNERLISSAAMTMDGTLATLSLMTVTFEPGETGTLLSVVEQGTFLDGHEQPSWREEGTSSWLDKLGAELGA